MKIPDSISHLTIVSRTLAVAAALTLALAWPAQAANVEVSVTLDPARIALGEAAQLAVTVQGNQSGEPSLPRVDGLEFTPVGRSSSFQSINGAVTASVSHLYQVTALRAGTFNIPAIRVGGASSRPLVLQVLKAANGTAQSAGRALPPPNVNWPADQASGTSKGEPAFLRVVTPKQKLYVGELVPVQIKAYFRRGLGASLNGLPVLSSDAFTMSKLTGQPEQSQETVDGTPYTVLIWPASLSPVKAGDYTLTLELPVLVRVQERAARGQRQNPFSSFFGGSGFDDSFFDDFFGRVSEKPLTLKTDLAAMKVLPLPSSGRPADFSGAVGTFELRSEVTPATATAGDPLTLKLIINGTGNFDRVTSSGLPNSAAWKTYKVGARFETEDSAGLQGSKVFEQAVVPQQAGQAQLPALAFSYFDPATRQYVTRHTQPLAIEVAAASGHIQNVASRAVPSPVATPVVSKPRGDELFPNAVEPGRFVSSLRPMLFRPVFAVATATPLLLLAGGFWFLKRRARLAADPHCALELTGSANLHESLARMDGALQSVDGAAFFHNARRALQEGLARLWHIPPNAVTIAELNARLNGAGEEICSVFRLAEQAAYAGQSLAPGDLQYWRQIVRDELKRMEEL